MSKQRRYHKKKKEEEEENVRIEIVVLLIIIEMDKVLLPVVEIISHSLLLTYLLEFHLKFDEESYRDSNYEEMEWI
jgi:hypothetical protein